MRSILCFQILFFILMNSRGFYNGTFLILAMTVRRDNNPESGEFAMSVANHFPSMQTNDFSDSPQTTISIYRKQGGNKGK